MVILFFTKSALIAFFFFAAITIGIIIANLRKPYVKSEKHKLKFSDEDLFKALGGKANVEAMQSNRSKLYVKLFDMNNFDANAIKKLGASGIVARSQELVIIFGKASSQISQNINTKLKDQ